MFTTLTLVCRSATIEKHWLNDDRLTVYTAVSPLSTHVSYLSGNRQNSTQFNGWQFSYLHKSQKLYTDLTDPLTLGLN